MNYTTKQTQSQVQAVTSYNSATKYRRTSLRYWSYLLLLGLLHGQTDAMTLLIHFQNDHIDHVADLDCLAGMAQTTVRHLRNVDQTILMDADINEYAKVNDITDRTGQFHTGL